MSQLLTNLGRGAIQPRTHIEKLFANESIKLCIVPSRTKYYNNKHWNPIYRKERSRKTWKVYLPDFDEDKYNERHGNKLSPDEIRAKLKEKGIAPPTVWNEKEVYSPCTIAFIEPFVPPTTGETSSSLIDKLKTPISGGSSFVKDRRALSQLRTFEGEDFNLKEFAKNSLEIYIKAHEALAAKEENKIFDYVTEHCFPLMAAGLERHTITWQYLGDIEEPVVVQTRIADLAAKGNKFSQITVKFHTKQLLAIYDRHGRLVLGSPRDVKEVLEYVVFEKYIANEYGLWRMHGRIRPQEADTDSQQQVSKTYVKQAI